MRLLGGRYLLEEQVAGGGMASVWRAHDEVLARPWPSRCCTTTWPPTRGFRERFRREAVAAAKLTHPNIVSLYDTGRDDDRVYLVLEYVEGATLAEVLAHHGAPDPGQSPRRSCSASRGRWTTRTSAAWCTATSSPRTSCWAPTGW